MTAFFLGLFLLAAGTLMYEIVLTRLLSVISWYYLAFVAVSMAMFGMTAGALAVQLRPAQFTTDQTPQHLARAVFAMAVTLPLVLMTMLAVPIEISYTAQTLYTFLLFSAIIAVPFFFSGVAICLALTRTTRPIGRVYFVDLAGAAAGCFAAVGLLYLLDGPSAVLAISALLCISAAAFAAHAALPRIRMRALIGAAVLTSLAAANSTTYHGIQPMWTKGQLDRRTHILAEIWNPISKVRASQPGTGTPWMWGPSPRMPNFEVRSIGLNIDNDASTPITQFTGDPKELEFLQWDVTSIAPQLRPGGAVAIIGVGGGRDVLNAHANGARRIVGIEINGAMVELAAHRLREFSGLHKIPALELHVDEGRSYLTRTDEQFDVIQASLVDTWAATSAGAVTLSENALYTVEGWQTFYRRLRPGGLLTFSRWNQGAAQHQTMRLFALAWATLLAEGIAHPHEHLALVSSPEVATLLLRNQPLAPADLERLREIATEKEFSILFMPSAREARSQAQQQTAGAPTPAAPTSGLPAEKASVEGYVMRAADSQPLKRARVRLMPMGNPGAPGGGPQRGPQPIGAITDALGKFSMRDLAPGQYRLIVERNGFVRQAYGARSVADSGSPLTLTAGQRVRDVTFRMIAAAAITGHIYDDEGEPMPNVQVRAMRHSYTRGLRQMMPVGASSTNDLGEYRVYGLAPGRYYLVAFPGNAMSFGNFPGAPGSSGEDEREQAYVPIYYPGSMNPESAALVTVGPGDELTRYDLTLVPQQAVRVRGRIANVPAASPGGRGRGGLQVNIVPRNMAMRFFRGESSDMVDAQGNFELRGVTPGSYIVTAGWSDQNTVYTAREFLDVGGADVDGISLTLAPAADVSGKLRVEGPLDLKTTRVRVTLRPLEEFGGGGNAPVGPDGTFTIRGLPPGTYAITTAGDTAGYYLKSARVGAADVLERGITLAAGRNPGAVELVLSGTAAQISGLALNDDGLPVGGATVVLIPPPRLRHHTALFRSTTADQNGRFTLRNLPPGEYKLFAWEEAEPDAWFDPQFLVNYEDRGVKVEAAESGVHTFDAKILKSR